MCIQKSWLHTAEYEVSNIMMTNCKLFKDMLSQGFHRVIYFNALRTFYENLRIKNLHLYA